MLYQIHSPDYDNNQNNFTSYFTLSKQYKIQQGLELIEKQMFTFELIKKQMITMWKYSSSLLMGHIINISPVMENNLNAVTEGMIN